LLKLSDDPDIRPVVLSIALVVLEGARKRSGWRLQSEPLNEPV